MRVLRTWFETYVETISPLSWFLSKLQGELGMFRQTLHLRNMPVCPEAEKLAFKVVEQDLLRANQPQGLRNLAAFKHWQQDQAACQAKFGQARMLDDNETRAWLEGQVSQSAGSGLLWTFRG